MFLFQVIELFEKSVRLFCILLSVHRKSGLEGETFGLLPGGSHPDGTLMGLPVNDLLVFPTVLVGHHETEIFGMLVIIAQFLLPFPFLQVALYDLEPLRLFEVNPYGNLLAAYVQFNGLSLSYLLLLLCAQLDVVDLLHVFQFLL